MIDREKVIKGLNNIGREIVNTIGHGEAVPYLRTIDDAIALLKQEAVEPILDSFLHKRCPSCKTMLRGRFCHECGQAVKWE